ncbi:MAG: hypothetical protein J7501_13710 [Bdellovibrio sp.]|nr:hypothetical protein [Bdellovibrio sp.]
MKTSMTSTILALILMSYSSFGWGRDNLANPTVISGLGAVKDHNACQIIKIRSYAYSENKIYAQEGVGWVVKSTQGTHILLPAHVIAGSNLLAGECGDRSFPLTLKNKSETLDLALLNTPEQAASFLFPLIDLQDRNESLKNIKGDRKVRANALVPEHTTEALKFAMRNQEMNYYLVPSKIPDTPERFNSYGGDMQIVGFSHMAEGLHSLIVESLAIRPGFSGSPFFVKAPPEKKTPEEAVLALTNPDLYYRPYLAGMLTKVEINGSRSLGVSLPKILEALPRLMSSEDADAGRALRLRYIEKVTAGVLERSQEMVQTLSDGSHRVYTEICNDSTAESSEWIKTEKEPNPQTKTIIKEISIDPQKVKTMRYDDLSQAIKDLKDSKVGSAMQRSGGDYGEGGGNLLSLRNATFLVPVLDDTTSLSYLSSYKIKKNCDQSMIRDNYGAIFDSKNVDGRQVKTTTLAELYNALSNPNAGKNSCINASLEATRYMDQSTTTLYLMNGTKYIYLRTEGEAKKGQAGAQSITCDGNTTRVNFSSANIKMDVSFSKSGKSQGYINLTSAQDKSCEVQLTPRTYRSVGSWKHIIRSKDLDADIVLGDEGRVFSLKILRVSEACSPTDIGKLWMQEINFSEGSKLSK